MNSPGISFNNDFISQPNVIEGRFGQHVSRESVARQYKIKALVPMHGTRRNIALDEKISRSALAAVLFAHIVIFAALLNATISEPQLKAAAAPMMVNLVASPAPEPEVVPLLPEPPKPEPVVKKELPKPKPVVREVTPEPQPIVAEQPVFSEPAPAAITPEQPAVVAKAPPAPMPVVAPVVEPRIEPPQFGAAYLENPAPAYPPQSRRFGEEGRVLLRVLVSENGNAATVEVDSGSGSERLDAAALKAVKNWRFIPAKRNNQPISAYVIVPIKFSLQG
jgi:protein TonB